MRDWIDRHGAVVMLMVLVVIALYLRITEHGDVAETLHEILARWL